ncbi:MAG: DJ-1/PfpI family protein [Gemmatimonadetes bacterium]|nr:DJ-1/PfpI family protein [Gemmatimonadota bacterium]NIR81001.1 DJ-1/PfpI family protein [Gemmatimonadota bacterium]NIT89976.1 DJ-1/PfpI family protein [Gemmatimonadota bacterium]NIU33611.1 DJ-1/PfpI family protein [Gemmatimonadota bacterium]NIU37864.1 DJ-1/PfpI family protein [Gemmatimonadota bacterium]
MKIAFVAFEGMTVLDLVSVFDPLTRLRTMEIRPSVRWNVVALAGRVADRAGLRILPDRVAHDLGGYDLLVVPGGPATRELKDDPGFVDWIRSAEGVPLKASVCTGALLLGAAGFLEGRRATTHPTAFSELAPYCGRVEEARVVDEGDVVTAGGVTAGLDLGLHLCERLAGSDATSRIARQMDFRRRPPEETVP